MALPALCLEPHILLGTGAQCQASSDGLGPSGLPWCESLLPELRRGVITVQEAFVQAFWPIVKNEARRYARVGGDFDDLTGEGALALWEAALYYNPQSHRTSFTRYVQNQIHRRVRRAYLAQQGYHGEPTVIPLPIGAADTNNTELSLAEWNLDLKAAYQSLNEFDRKALQHNPCGEIRTARDRKRRQRARTRLIKALRHPSTTDQSV